MNTTLRYIENRLRGFVPDEEQRETALWIAEEATGLSRSEILCKDTTIIPNIEILLQRVLSGEPLQYIFGKAYWGGMTLHVNRSTLIPRPETWELAEAVFSAFTIDSRLRVLDIGTGSGCIAIALKKHFPLWTVEACDISAEALTTAKANAAANSADVSFFRCDILREEIDAYDVIVSNPPYVMLSEKTGMQRRVADYEPASALFVPDDDPLLFYRRIALLRKSRRLFFEINCQMGRQLEAMLQDAGYTAVTLLRDLQGNDRIVTAQLP